MSLKYALGYASYVGTLVLGRPSLDQRLQSSGNITHLSQPSDLQALNLNGYSPSNASIASVNVAGGTDIHIKCDGASYGFDLDIGDCEEAKAFVPAGSDRVQWAERHTGWQKKIMPLPYRSMGDKALCYVQPVLLNGAPSAKASLNQIRNTAAAIRHTCAPGGKLQGGIATNIGGDNNLAVILGAYHPPSEIQCGGTFMPRLSCEDVLEDMPATTDKETFGPPTDPTAKVWLPQAVESDDTYCQLRIFGVSPGSDTASWYEVWEATTAIWSACVRHERYGSLRGFGKSPRLGVVKKRVANAIGFRGREKASLDNVRCEWGRNTQRTPVSDSQDSSCAGCGDYLTAVIGSVSELVVRRLEEYVRDGWLA